MDKVITTAFCYPDGQIHFGLEATKGAKVIAVGEDMEVRSLLEVTSRHAYEPGVLLVPGVPEAVDLVDAKDALLDFVDWLDARHPPGITFPLANQDKADRSTSLERFQRTAAIAKARGEG